MPWLQLIRWKNLLIIFSTQFLAWRCVILPLSPEVLDTANFCCLTLSTMLIAAAGYIINDYFDIKIDSINRPGRLVLEKVIPRKQAILSHILLNIVALLLAGYVAAKAHHVSLISIQVLSITLLWFYSTHFKRMFMIGNLVISFLTALTITMLVIYEPVLLRHLELPAFEEVMYNYLYYNPYYLTINPASILSIYAFYAFMLNWIREIAKDMEDLKGDTEEGCQTMPVKWGLYRSIISIRLLVIIVLMALAYYSYFLFLWDYSWLGLYIVLLVMLPLIIWMAKLAEKNTPEHFHKMSTWLKLIMLSGLCSLIVYFSVVWIRALPAFQIQAV